MLLMGWIRIHAYKHLSKILFRCTSSHTHKKKAAAVSDVSTLQVKTPAGDILLFNDSFHLRKNDWEVDVEGSRKIQAAGAGADAWRGKESHILWRRGGGEGKKDKKKKKKRWSDEWMEACIK